jgi:hypothetical protein
MESNPRQVKRFINRFIVSHENSVEQSNPSRFLVFEMLKERWSEFYKNMDIKDFIDKVKNLVTKEDEERIKIFNELKARENDKDNPLNDFEKILINFRSDIVLWKFLKKCKDNNSLFGLEEKEEEIKEKVNIHRRASESVKEISDVTPSEDLVKLLLTGKINEFNATLQKGSNRYLEFARINLSNANLSNALLPFTLLLDCKRYKDMICDGAYFQDALTDNQDFRLYLEKHNARILPLLLKSKGELKNKLEERGLGEYYIQYLLEHSSLP